MDGREIWKYKHCASKLNKRLKIYLVSGGTTNIKRHLLKEHSIVELSPSEQRLADQQSSIEEAIIASQSNLAKRRKLAPEVPLEKELDPAILESLFIRFIATNNQALRLVECTEFRTFLTYLNENVNIWLPSTHNTVGE
jgi:hypothetical protein